MKQQEIFKKIGTILKELNEQYEYLGSAGDSLNDLELELFVANGHFLAEHSEVLRKLSLQSRPSPVANEERSPKKQEEPPQKPEERYFEPVVQQVVPEPEPIEPPKPEEPKVADAEDTPVPHIDLSANGADDDFSIMRHEEPEVIKHELVLDESHNWEDEEEDNGFEIEEVAEPEKPVIAPPKAKTIEPEPEPVKPQPLVEVKTETPSPVPLKATPPAEVKAEPVTEEPLTVNQMISAQLHKTTRVSEQLHTQSITDLKQAITLNDKLLYIRDLFNGYNLAYSEAIDILNRFQSFEEAENFLQTNYAVKNHWDSKQATADRFYELLRRRFA